MKKSLLTIALGLIGFASFSQVVVSTTASHNLKINAASILDVALTDTAAIVFDFNTVEKYESGITLANAAELKVRSTKPWKINVNSSYTVPAGSGLDITKLTVKKNGAAAFVAINSASQIATGNRGGQGVSTNNFKLDYEFNPGYIQEGTYTIPVVYTISAQ